MIENLEGEIWMVHPKYNWIAASNLGRIKSIERNITYPNGSVHHYKEHLFKPSLDKDGYLKFKLSIQFKKEIYPKVHRFVYESFNQMIIPNNLEINHLNEIRNDNRLENLSLIKHIDNINYGTHNEKIAKALTNRKDLSLKVRQYTLDGELVRDWESTREAERNGFDHSTISKCCRGKLKTYKNFIWKYIE